MPPNPQPIAGEALPRSLRVIGIPVAGVLLVAFFVLRGFPYDALGDRIAAELARSQNVRLAFAELGPAFQLAGPAVEARGVRLQTAGGETVQLDRALLRPAWSLAWFSANPAVYAELEGPMGSAHGMFILGETPAWDGTLRDVDLASLPLQALLPGGNLEGRVDATLDIRWGERGPEGPVHFEVRDGVLSLPGLPIALPFELLTADLLLGGDAFAVVESLTLEGPIVSGSGSGEIGRAPTFERAPLKLEFQLTVTPALAGAVRGAGVRVDRDGRAVVRVSGNVSNPRVR